MLRDPQLLKINFLRFFHICIRHNDLLSAPEEEECTGDIPTANTKLKDVVVLVNLFRKRRSMIGSVSQLLQTSRQQVMKLRLLLPQFLHELTHRLFATWLRIEGDCKLHPLPAMIQYMIFRN